MPAAPATTASSQTPLQGRMDVVRLTVLHAPDPEAFGRVRLLDSEPVELGRCTSAGEELGLDDPLLSRNHLRIARQGEEWLATDLGSSHGTRVDGVVIDQTPLRSGAILRAGDCVLLFEALVLDAGTPLVSEAPPLWGPSIALHHVRGDIARVATQPLTVLATGETGVGKELVARAIHERSGRTGAFVPVNCAAIPRELFERELFGHVRGAFTGADRGRGGLFDEAEGGTLFLDEVGELPLDLQPKLLRALAESEVRPVGSASVHRVDVRVVAATNRDLSALVETASFRSDLLARLSAWTLRVPPLRERPADVLSLARRFLPTGWSMTANVAEALLLHPWPTNVRELRSTIAAARVRAGARTCLEREDLPAEVTARVPLDPQTRVSVPVALELQVRPDAVPTRSELSLALRHFEGNISKVAGFFRRDRKQVYRWIRRHGLEER